MKFKVSLCSAICLMAITDSHAMLPGGSQSQSSAIHQALFKPIEEMSTEEIIHATQVLKSATNEHLKKISDQLNETGNIASMTCDVLKQQTQALTEIDDELDAIKEKNEEGKKQIKTFRSFLSSLFWSPKKMHGTRRNITKIERPSEISNEEIMRNQRVIQLDDLRMQVRETYIGVDDESAQLEKVISGQLDFLYEVASCMNSELKKQRPMIDRMAESVDDRLSEIKKNIHDLNSL